MPQVGAHLEHRNEDGMTALYLACQEGHVTIVKALLIAGAEVDSKHNDGATPLMSAASNGHENCLAKLLQACLPVPEHQHLKSHWLSLMSWP